MSEYDPDNDPYTPPPWLDRLILGVFVTGLVFVLIALALFVRIG